MLRQPRSVLIWTAMTYALVSMNYVPRSRAASNGGGGDRARKLIKTLERKVYPALVRMRVRQPMSTDKPRNRRKHFGYGILVDPAGIVVFPARLRREAKHLEVELSDGRKLTPKQVIADTANEFGILRLEKAKKAYPTAALGDSDRVEPGQPAVSLHPIFGDEVYIERCLISGKAPVRKGAEPLIFADGALGPPLDGDVLVNLQGEIIGIRKETGLPRAPFGVVPSNRVRKALHPDD